jgi:hypothetical protein
MTAKKLNYRGWPNCYRIANGIVDLIVTTDVGPRITRFGFIGEENEFGEFEEETGRRGGSSWRAYGGHRLWHAPESQPRTYDPDNSPVTLERHSGFLRLVQPTEKSTGIQKEIDIRLSPRKAHVSVTHRLRNTNLWNVELSVWALSIMALGGRAIIPLPPRGEHPKHLQPSSTLTLWPYTDLGDPRWSWGFKYVMLQQDRTRPKPQKIGALVSPGWAAYARSGHLFVKQFKHDMGARYPDLGCSVETFTNDRTLEVETLGSLVSLAPGASIDHVEHWFLFRDVPVPNSDAEIDRHVLPKIRALK